MTQPRPVGAKPGRVPRLKAPIDPRNGDIESDASSTKSRTLFSLAGGLLAEVSLPKLVVALVMLIVVPSVFLGLAPLLATMWFRTVKSPGVVGLWALVLLAGLVAIAWLGGRRLLRLVEDSFWSLHAMAIQPLYAAGREVLLHLADRLLPKRTGAARRATMRAAAAAVSGGVICAVALWVASRAWPTSRWVGSLADLRTPHRLAVIAVANSVVLVAGYLAVASLIWGVADAIMPQPRDVTAFHARADVGRTWRIAHVSDIHVVGERYGFRLGSGRTGPRGNERLRDILARLDEFHRQRPLDAIVITGDLTDAGTTAEWAELLDALTPYPQLVELIVAMPGNHDLNVVDRANPARLDLPTSPKKRLRQLRTMSVLAAIQGKRVRVVDNRTRRLGDTLTDALEPYLFEMTAFADTGTRRRGKALPRMWEAIFPMVRPPDTDDGLGIIVLNSNAETHFSFTNALGLVSADQARAIDDVVAQYPRAFWIVALHHHIVEYPPPKNALAERIGTTLINGRWFTRRLQRVADRAVVMHGHRHMDWIGQCGELAIVSAPSAVMESSGAADSYFYVHTLGVDRDEHLALLEPERVVVRGDGTAPVDLS